MTGRVDVHQHLWPTAFLDALRARTRAPRLVGWRLELDGEPDYEVRAADHDLPARRRADADCIVIGVSLSSPLGIEELDPTESAPLLDAWHRGAAELGEPYAGWASVTRREPDLIELARLLSDGFLGLQIPATWLATPTHIESLAPVLRICEQADRPVLVHPGPVSGAGSVAQIALPAWWPAVVDYPAQLQAAWWAWHEAGRSLLPRLRICFAAGAGLGPAHHERFAARGGRPRRIDLDSFVETSSYGSQGLDALVRALGIDVIVLGSDRPYAQPIDSCGGDAATRAITLTNPLRLLNGG